ncbi:HAD family hydrolase [Sphingopyxis kveilinensis]|uniref:HAD family hydrolase n=1 Tax=Sphingopyxis kveilinensis TaxID=3114367 RepID=UPI0030CE4766
MDNAGHPFVLVCDLDDTLYLERDYVASGFEAVGGWAEKQLSLPDFGRVAWQLFQTGHRERIFDVALQQLGVTGDSDLIQQMVSVYRGHKPAIAIRDDVQEFLHGAHGLGGLALVTDGFREAQENKIAALRLGELGFYPIVVTDVWGRDYWKPHPRAFRLIADAFEGKPRRFVYIADNAAKDFLAPNQLGWTTVQISRKGGLHNSGPPTPDHAPAMRIASFDQLSDALGIAQGHMRES